MILAELPSLIMYPFHLRMKEANNSASSTGMYGTVHLTKTYLYNFDPFKP